MGFRVDGFCFVVSGVGSEPGSVYFSICVGLGLSGAGFSIGSWDCVCQILRIGFPVWGLRVGCSGLGGWGWGCVSLVLGCGF